MKFKLRFRWDNCGIADKRTWKDADLSQNLVPIREQLLLKNYIQFDDEDDVEDFLLDRKTWKNLANKDKSLEDLQVMEEVDTDYLDNCGRSKYVYDIMNRESYEIAQQAIEELRELNQ